MVLKTIGDGAGMGAAISFKTVAYAIVVEDIVQLDSVEP
jgi:hypothetical protein